MFSCISSSLLCNVQGYKYYRDKMTSVLTFVETSSLLCRDTSISALRSFSFCSSASSSLSVTYGGWLTAHSQANRVITSTCMFSTSLSLFWGPLPASPEAISKLFSLLSLLTRAGCVLSS